MGIRCNARPFCDRNHKPAPSAAGARAGRGAAAREPRVARGARAARREARPLAAVARCESRTRRAALRPRHSRPLAAARRWHRRLRNSRARIPALAPSYVTFFRCLRRDHSSIALVQFHDDSYTTQNIVHVHQRAFLCFRFVHRSHSARRCISRPRALCVCSSSRRTEQRSLVLIYRSASSPAGELVKEILIVQLFIIGLEQFILFLHLIQ